MEFVELMHGIYVWYCCPGATKFRSCSQTVIISLGDVAPAVFLILTDAYCPSADSVL